MILNMNWQYQYESIIYFIFKNFYIFPSSIHQNKPEAITNQEQSAPLVPRLWSSNAISHQEKEICSFKKMTYSSSGRGNIQDVAGISHNRKQKCWQGLLELCQKGSGEPTWKGSLGQKWYGIIFSINKNNNFNKLKCIKYINPWVHNNMQITKNNN